MYVHKEFYSSFKKHTALCLMVIEINCISDQGEQKRQRWEGVQQPADDPGFLLV